MEEKAERLKAYGQWALTILLVVLWGYFIATTVLLLVERRYITAPRLAVVKKTLVEKQKAKTLDEYLAGLKALFPTPAPTQSTGDGSQPSPADLGPMNLVATIIGDGTALAVINVAKKDEVVSSGQALGTYKVKNIFRNKVILSNGAQQVVLKMKYGEPDEPTPSPSPTAEAKTEPGVIRKEISRREFEAITDPPDKIAREIGGAPTSRDGKPYGIQLTFIKPGSYLQTIGFTPGDVISSINNKSTYTFEEMLMAWQMLKNEDTVDFKIDRGGRFIQLQLVFK
jgi:type II secretion system protein C